MFNSRPTLGLTSVGIYGKGAINLKTENDIKSVIDSPAIVKELNVSLDVLRARPNAPQTLMNFNGEGQLNVLECDGQDIQFLSGNCKKKKKKKTNQQKPIVFYTAYVKYYYNNCVCIR